MSDPLSPPIPPVPLSRVSQSMSMPAIQNTILLLPTLSLSFYLEHIILNTSIIVRNVHNVSFTSFENKRSPQIVFYKWNQYKNVPRDKLTTDMCTPFGFWNATSVSIDRLDMLVYQQNKPVDCLRVFGIIFANVTQLYLRHCNITIVRSTYSSFCSSYFIDSLFGTAEFSTTLCYQGSLYLTNGKNIEITKSTIVGGIEVYESAIATISDCNVLLVINRYIGTLYISKSRNIDVSDIFVRSDVLGHSNGISIEHTNHTKMTNVTVSNCPGTGLGLSYNIDTQVSNGTILFSSTGLSVVHSNNIALRNFGLRQNKFGIDMSSVSDVNISNLYVSGGSYQIYSVNTSLLSINNLTALNCTKNIFRFLHTTDTTVQTLISNPGKAKNSQMENREGLIISSNITIQNSSFSGSTSYWTTTDITRQRVVLEIYDSQVKMTNCSFVNNNITPLNLTETHLTVSGNLNFTNNTAYRGGATILIHNNTLSLSENSRVTFVGNRAIDTGGAVYVVTRTSYAFRDFVLG